MTEARALSDVDWWTRQLGMRNGSNRGMAEFVVATLDAARPLDVEGLAVAYDTHRGDGKHYTGPCGEACMRDVAAVYARLTAKDAAPLRDPIDEAHAFGFREGHRLAARTLDEPRCDFDCDACRAEPAE